MRRPPHSVFKRKFELQEARPLHQQRIGRNRLSHRKAVLQTRAYGKNLAENTVGGDVVNAVICCKRKRVGVVSAQHSDVDNAGIGFGQTVDVGKHNAVSPVRVAHGIRTEGPRVANHGQKNRQNDCRHQQAHQQIDGASASYVTLRPVPERGRHVDDSPRRSVDVSVVSFSLNLHFPPMTDASPLLPFGRYSAAPSAAFRLPFVVLK